MKSNEKQKLPPCQKNHKVKYHNFKKGCKNDTPNTEIHDRSLSWLGTLKGGVVN